MIDFISCPNGVGKRWKARKTTILLGRERKGPILNLVLAKFLENWKLEPNSFAINVSFTDLSEFSVVVS